jgi:hypothetical protein
MKTMKTLAILTKVMVIAAVLVATSAARALTIEELRNDPKLTPSRFARYFADFEYQRRAVVQTSANFLKNRNGDCDDFAILASMLLKEKGYTTRLVTIRLPEENHVVCYIEETKCYLDYNNRGYLLRTVSCGGSLEEIARKVARSMDSSWRSATEFAYVGDNMKQFLKTVIAKRPVGANLLAKYP